MYLFNNVTQCHRSIVTCHHRVNYCTLRDIWIRYPVGLFNLSWPIIEDVKFRSVQYIYLRHLLFPSTSINPTVVSRFLIYIYTYINIRQYRINIIRNVTNIIFDEGIFYFIEEERTNFSLDIPLSLFDKKEERNPPGILEEKENLHTREDDVTKRPSVTQRGVVYAQIPEKHIPAPSLSLSLSLSPSPRINEIAVRRYWDTACCGSIDIYFRRSSRPYDRLGLRFAGETEGGWQTLPRLVSIYSGFPRFSRLCRARSAPPVCIILYLFRLVTPGAGRPPTPFSRQPFIPRTGVTSFSRRGTREQPHIREPEMGYIQQGYKERRRFTNLSFFFFFFLFLSLRIVYRHPTTLLYQLVFKGTISCLVPCNGRSRKRDFHFPPPLSAIFSPSRRVNPCYIGIPEIFLL